MKLTAPSPIPRSDTQPDLFGAKPRLRPSRRVAPRSPELARAQSLCRQLRQAHTPDDKRRMAHLLCLSLKSMLQRPAEH